MTLFDRIGRALYGPAYKAQLAADLGLNHRTVQRIASGSMRTHPEELTKLLPLMRARQAELRQLIAEAERETGAA